MVVSCNFNIKVIISKRSIGQMKILVTGANGFLGRGIITELIKQGNEVIATDFETSLVSEMAFRIDSNTFEVEDPYVFYGKPDQVLHLAWRDGFIHNSFAHSEDLSKHITFLNKMVLAGVKISVMGTMHEIGFYEGSIDEHTPCYPANYYGIAKDALRNFVVNMTEDAGLQYQWLRAFYIVDNTSYGSSIFSKIVAAEKDDKTFFPFTTGKNQFDFLDYPEFCYQVAATVSQDKVNGIINICSGNPMKLSERVENFISENGFKIQLEYGAFPDRKYDSKAVWGNNKKIEQILAEK